MLDVPEAIFIATYELPIERRASFLQAHGYYPDGPRPWAKLVPRVPGVKV